MWIRLDGDGPLFRQLYRALRAGILDGVVRPGTRLPATRTLACELGLSRTTVLLAYEQLAAEGYLDGRRGSGSYVQAAATPASAESAAHRLASPLRAPAAFAASARS